MRGRLFGDLVTVVGGPLLLLVVGVVLVVVLTQVA